MKNLRKIQRNLFGYDLSGISIYRGGKKAETEEKMVELGRLVYNEWKKRE